VVRGMAAEPLEVRMARLEGAYERIDRRPGPVEAAVQDLRAEIRELRAQMGQEISDLRRGTRQQFFRLLGVLSWRSSCRSRSATSRAPEPRGTPDAARGGRGGGVTIQTRHGSKSAPPSPPTTPPKGGHGMLGSVLALLSRGMAPVEAAREAAWTSPPWTAVRPWSCRRSSPTAAGSGAWLSTLDPSTREPCVGMSDDSD
jgi:hypothetical protein